MNIVLGAQVREGCQTDSCTCRFCRSHPQSLVLEWSESEIPEKIEWLATDWDSEIPKPRLCKHVAARYDAIIRERGKAYFTQLLASDAPPDLSFFREYFLPNFHLMLFQEGDSAPSDDLMSSFYDYSVRHVDEFRPHLRYFRELVQVWLAVPREQHWIHEACLIFCFGCFVRIEYFESEIRPLLEHVLGKNGEGPIGVFWVGLARKPRLLKRVVASLQTIVSCLCLNSEYPIDFEKNGVAVICTVLARFFEPDIVAADAMPPSSWFASQVFTSQFRVDQLVLTLDEMGYGKFHETAISKCPMMFTMEFKNELKFAMTEFLREEEALEEEEEEELGEQRRIPTFVVTVRRDHIVEDTKANYLGYTDKNVPSVTKVLNVKFVGEHGVDMGGVSREFFMLYAQEIVKPEQKLFVVQNGYHWFSVEEGLESKEDARVLGMVVATAALNEIPIPLDLPDFLYKRLKNLTPQSLTTLQELEPEVARSFKFLLNCPPEEVNEAGLTFSKTVETSTGLQTFDLCPDGRNIPVTGQNIKSYVKQYIQWTLYTSVESKVNSFIEGFRCMWPETYCDYFMYEELKTLIAGESTIRWEDLRDTALYENYVPTDKTVVDFWQFVYSLSEADKHKLLIFLYGSDHIPYKGFIAQRLILSKTTDTRMLPVAKTCANILFLPDYQDLEVLTRHMMVCLENCQGFGLI